VLLFNARIGLIGIGTTYAWSPTAREPRRRQRRGPGPAAAHVSINTTGLAIDENLSIPGSTSPGIVVRFSTANQVVSFEALKTPRSASRPER